MNKIVRIGLFAACACLLVAGCASYYKVIDPESGREYYTQKVETITGGAVKLKDARTGNIVTIQNSEVKEINSEDYKTGLSAPVKQAPAAPAPAPASAPSGTPASEATGQTK